MNVKVIPRNQVTALLLTFGVMLLVSQNLQGEDKSRLLSSRDGEIVRHEAGAGAAAIKVGELGAQKAQSHHIRLYAATMVTEQTKLDTDLQLLAAHKEFELPATLPSPNGDGLRKLEKAEGLEFDRLFLAEVENSHQQRVSKLEEAARNAQDVDLKRWAENTIQMLRAQHSQLHGLGTGIVATTGPASHSSAPAVGAGYYR